MEISVDSTPPSPTWSSNSIRPASVDRSGEFPEPAELSCVLAGGRDSHATSESAKRLQRDIFEELLYSLGRMGSVKAALLGEGVLPALLDPTEALHGVNAETASAEQARALLEYQLSAAFDRDPLEDGMTHPAEEIIRSALGSGDAWWSLDSLARLSANGKSPSFAASVLRCLGRQEEPGSAVWRASVIEEALATDSVEVRDAAVQAAEAWGGPEIRSVLQRHTEPSPWLRDYARDVIEDLAE